MLKIREWPELGERIPTENADFDVGGPDLNI